MTGHRPFAELRAALPADTLGLRRLRALRDLTQVEVAAALGSVQPAVSRTERQDDILLSTLRAYVEATGGVLRLIAVYPDAEHEIRQP